MTLDIFNFSSCRIKKENETFKRSILTNFSRQSFFKTVDFKFDVIFTELQQGK